jgi:hypothetical protein
MKHKAILLIIGFAVLINDCALADAFPKSFEALGGPVVSLEVLGSYEMRFKSNFGLSAWGGMATIFSPYGLDINAGPEAAIEFRKYFHEKENKIWSIGFYSGVAYNLINERYGAFTPGLKITRTKTVNNFIQLEPYISLSYPFYFGEGHPLLPYLTFGYRLVFEKKKK